MKTLYIILITICLLPGCTYSSANLIRAQGTDLKVAVNPIVGTYKAEGKDVAVTFFRQSGIHKSKYVVMPNIQEAPQKWELVNNFEEN